ncbi:MAG: ABC transporter permease [Tissierellaceae bacterium]
MTKFYALVRGELLRLKRYNLFAASLLVSGLWVAILHLVNIDDVSEIVPQLIFLDVTTMAVLLIGVTFIYEREEGTIRTLLVSPVSKSEYLLAKLLSHIIPSIISFTIMFIYSKIFKSIDINYLYMLGSLILVALFHSLVGLLLTYFSKNFTDLVMGIMKLFFVMVVPVILDQFNIVNNALFKRLVYIIPTKSALMLIMGPTGMVGERDLFISIAYIITASLILYYLIWKKFDSYALREGVNGNV